MNVSLKFLAVGLSVFLFLFVLELTRREKLTFKYALSWIGASLLAVFFALYHQLVYRLAYWLGFELPSNFIFFAFVFVSVIITLLMTIFLCDQNRRNDLLAQKMGLLEQEVGSLSARISGKDETR